MATKGTWRALWTPAAFPAPPLSLESHVWRYGLALLAYLGFAIPYVTMLTNPAAFTDHTPWLGVLDLRHPLVGIDVLLGAAALVVVALRRRAPFVVSLALTAMGVLSVSSGVAGMWALMSLASRRRWPLTAVAGAAFLADAEGQRLVPWLYGLGGFDWFTLGLGLLAVVVLVGLGAWHGVLQDRRAAALGADPRPDSPLVSGLRGLFEPARYPAPRLDGTGIAWRYAVAGSVWLFFLAIYSFGVSQPDLFVDAAGSPGPLEPGAAPTVAVSPVAPPGGVESGLQLEPRAEGGVGFPPIAVIVADLVLGLGMLIAVHWRRRHPLAVALGTQAAAVFSLSGSGAAVWALMSLASRRKLRDILLALGAVGVTGVLVRFLPWRSSPQALPEFLGGLAGSMATMAALMLLGMYHGLRQDRTAGVQDLIESAGRDRELAVLSERNRIAREMHDVLAHRISLVSMHAGALAYRTDLPPEQTRDIARIIQENAHASLTELRAVLSTLRDGQLDAAGAPAAPQPTLTQLPQLVDEARSLGQRVAVEVDADLAAVPQVTARHAYRIVQECLTNARKHAPYAQVELFVGGRPGLGLDLRVANALTSLGGGVPGAGLGLIGIRERVGMLGGRVDIAARDGHFVVSAWLPWTQ